MESQELAVIFALLWAVESSRGQALGSAQAARLELRHE
jgi:hypothetical protein